jgi:hypothetical protein
VLPPRSTTASHGLKWIIHSLIVQALCNGHAIIALTLLNQYSTIFDASRYVSGRCCPLLLNIKLINLQWNSCHPNQVSLFQLSINEGMFDVASEIFNQIIKRAQNAHNTVNNVDIFNNYDDPRRRRCVNDAVFQSLDDNMKERIRRPSKDCYDIAVNDSLTSILLCSLNTAIWSRHVSSMLSFIELLLINGARVSRFDKHMNVVNAAAPW